MIQNISIPEGKTSFIAERRYIGSVDGFSFDAFHSKSDNLGPTVTLLLTNKKTSLAGITFASWSSENKKKYIEDENAKILNLSKRLVYNC